MNVDVCVCVCVLVGVNRAYIGCTWALMYAELGLDCCNLLVRCLMCHMHVSV